MMPVTLTIKERTPNHAQLGDLFRGETFRGLAELKTVYMVTDIDALKFNHQNRDSVVCINMSNGEKAIFPMKHKVEVLKTTIVAEVF